MWQLHPIEINGFRSTDTLLGLLPRVPVFSSIIACYVTPTGGFTKATTNFDDVIERRFYFPPALEKLRSNVLDSFIDI